MSWRSIAQNSSGRRTPSSSSTLATNSPGRLVVVVFAFFTSARANSRCSTLRATCASTCAAVAPG
jgi:hypothetical protein